MFCAKSKRRDVHVEWRLISSSNSKDPNSSLLKAGARTSCGSSSGTLFISHSTSCSSCFSRFFCSSLRVTLSSIFSSSTLLFKTVHSRQMHLLKECQDYQIQRHCETCPSEIKSFELVVFAHECSWASSTSAARASCSNFFSRSSSSRFLARLTLPITLTFVRIVPRSAVSKTPSVLVQERVTLWA